MSNYKHKANKDYAREYAKQRAEQYSYIEFKKDYSDDDILLNLLWRWQFGNAAIKCNRCGKYAKHYRAKKTTQFACGNCGNLVTPLKHTPFYRSHIPLSMWFYAIYLFTINKNRLTAKELERVLGVQYRTAYTMLNKIQKLLATETHK